MIMTKTLTSPILFDIDKTLFDTPGFTQDLLIQVDNLLNRFAVVDLTAEELFNQYLYTLKQTSHFRIEDLIRFSLKKLSQYPIAESDLRQLETLVFEHLEKDFLYPEVKTVVHQLDQAGFELGIFSQSHDPTFQRLKVKPIAHYFNPALIFISEAKTDSTFLKQLPLQATIIDDKPEVVLALFDFAQKNNRNWQIFLIDRYQLVKPQIEKKLKRLGIKTINSLKDLIGGSV